LIVSEEDEELVVGGQQAALSRDDVKSTASEDTVSTDLNSQSDLHSLHQRLTYTDAISTPPAQETNSDFTLDSNNAQLYTLSACPANIV